MARFFSSNNAVLQTTAIGAATPPLTMVCWYRHRAGSPEPNQNILVVDDGASHFYSLRTVSRVPIAAVFSTTYNTSTGAVAAVEGVWNHHAAVFASTSSRTGYFNGVAAPTDTVLNAPVATLWKVGTIYNGTQYGADGDIAEIAYYAAALTASEIAALAAGVSPLQIRPSALLAYYPLYGNDSPEPDRWRNRYDLTLYGVPPKSDHPRVYRAGALIVPPVPLLAASFAATATVRLAASAALQIAAALSAASTITVGAFGGFNDPLRATTGLRVSTVAALSAPVYFRAAAAISFSSAASSEARLGGTAAFHISSRAGLDRSPRWSSARFELGGVDITSRVRKGVTIRDVLNDSPNNATLKIEDGPGASQPLRITIDDGLIELFAGTLQQLAQTYEGGKPSLPIWACTATDRVPVRRPFGTWVNVSATTIAAEMSAAFAVGFTTDIEATLPRVSITFDGSEPFLTALVRLATMVGGYAKIDDGVIKLFLEDLADAPDPLDGDHPPLNQPPITRTEDVSQLRTRVYGKGYGENVPTDVLAGETIIPITNGAQFNPLGGRALAGTTADGAQSQQITYAEVSRPVGGTLVGTGATPTTAPALGLADGIGVESGLHDYAIVFATASGKSLAGPRATIVVGPIPPPSTAITPGVPNQSGGTVEPGTYQHYAVFKTAAGGRTLAGPAGAAVTLGAGVAGPTRIGPANSGGIQGNMEPGSYTWRYSFKRSADGKETALSPISSVFTSTYTEYGRIYLNTVDEPPSGFVRQWYRCRNGQTAGPFWQTAAIESFPSAAMYDGNANSTLVTPPPSTNLGPPTLVPLTTIPVSPSSAVTHVELYRELNFAGAATARLIGTVTNGTTSVNDGINSGQLGPVVPSTNTAIANQVRVSWAAGPTAVTAIEIYRTRLGSTTLRYAGGFASNAAGSFVDGTPDASLGPVAPTDDTSGLTQPQGQVNPGSPDLIVASAGPFLPTGGWVITGGGQVVRYTGISGQRLIGIPATGPGAIVTAIIYGQQATPAPVLVGVAGLTRAMAKGSAVHIFVQRDDLDAQAEEAQRSGGDGVIEYLLSDGRRSEPSLIARCDAELALFSRPLITVTYASRDPKTKSGKSIVINLPGIVETLTIQEVTISEIDVAPHTMPRFSVSASSVRFSLENMLRRLAQPQ